MLGSVTGAWPSPASSALLLLVAMLAAPTPGRTELVGLTLLPPTLKRDRVLGLRMTERDAADEERRDLRASMPEVVGR